MILVSTPSFLATTLETQTSTKVDKIVVNYSTFLGTKDDKLQGYIKSSINSFNGDFIYSLEPIEVEVFTGNILQELHGMYMMHLSGMNPELTFTSTL